MRTPPAVVALVLACSPGGGHVTSFAGPGGSPASESSESSGSSSISSSSSSSSSGSSTHDASTHEVSSGTTAMDMGEPPDFGPPGPVGCQGKIDFLFVISDSLLMEPYQARLIAAFPTFMKTIADEFDAFDAHILVTENTSGWGDSECQDCLWCSGCTCEQGGPEYPCGSGPQLTECDGLIGAGVVFPAGPGASNSRCELGGGHRYITADTPDPADAFECIARLGAPDGAGGVPIDAMFAALGDGMNSPYGCNAGFLRDDALLVVTLIDLGDFDSDDWPFVWNLRIVDKKGGDADAIVVLAISRDRYDPDGFCKPYDQEIENRLHEFADEVAHGVKGSVCAPDYAPYFAEAAALALQQCELLAPG